MSKRLSFAALAIAGLCSLSGCGGKEGDAEIPLGEVPARAELPRFQKNNLEGLPGSVYALAKSSPIHWQPWVGESREMARDSGRLMLVIVAMPQQPSQSAVIAELDSDPAVVAEINRSYIPVLVDGDAVRELSLLTAELCSEIGVRLRLPLAVWMTPDCDPVAWIPFPSSDPRSVTEIFNRSHEMVSGMWMDDPAYVVRNSRSDQEGRIDRISKQVGERIFSTDPASDSLRALRQLTSLYDPISRSFDETGGLFPCGAIDLLAMGARMDGIPAELRGKCKVTVGYLLDDLMGSAMFDPLDGGAFNARRGRSWSFPDFQRDCATQARIAVSLLDACEVTGNRKALERALGVIEFAEKTYRTEAGLFCHIGGRVGDSADWLWRHDDLRELLSPEELTAWSLVSGIRENGNLPSEADPMREYLRANSFSFAKTPEQAAEELGTDVSSMEAMLARIRGKLIEVRNSRLKPAPGNDSGNASATFRMASAYASAYRITGDVSFREKAVSTLSKAKEAFADGPRLISCDSDAPASLVAGRAFVYGLAVHAALDVAAVTLDEAWILWAGDLSSTASEIFVQEGELRECPSDADMIGLPFADLVMLFSESSAGLFGMADSRLGALGIPFVPSFSQLVGGLPLDSISYPVSHSDRIQAALLSRFGSTCSYGAAVPGEMREAIARMPLKDTSRRAAASLKAEGGAPDPEGALIIGPGGEVRRIDRADDLAVPSLP